MVFVECNVPADLHCSGFRVPKPVGLLRLAVPNENTSGALLVQFPSLCLRDVNECYRAEHSHVSQVWSLVVPYFVWCHGRILAEDAIKGVDRE